jgi:hypothetical protein
VHPEQVIYIDDWAMFVEVAQGLQIQGIIHLGYESTRKTPDSSRFRWQTGAPVRFRN